MGKIFFLGDSITAGAWDTEGGWVGRVSKELMRKTVESQDAGGRFSCFPYNLGVQGNASSDVLHRLREEIPARCTGQESKQIVCAVGIKDSVYLVEEKRGFSSEAEFENNIVKILEEGMTIVDSVSFIGLLPVDENRVNPMPWSPDKAYLNERISVFNTIIRDVCARNGIPFLDLLQEWTLNNEYSDLLCDGIHPNAGGHARIADKAMPFLCTKDFWERHSGS